MSKSPPPRKRPQAGRPARVTVAHIAQATLSIGLAKATVRNVAEKLEMSVPGLYHYVDGQDALLTIAVNYLIENSDMPDEKGRAWDVWLKDYAHFVFDVFVKYPEFISIMAAGPSYIAGRARHLERILDVLVAQGFSLGDAYRAYIQITSAIVGAAAFEARRRASVASGHSPEHELEAIARELGPDQLPLSYKLFNERIAGDPDTFETIIGAMLDSIRAAQETVRRQKAP
jgi:AcrR family transcriptional regulator